MSENISNVCDIFINSLIQFLSQPFLTFVKTRVGPGFARHRARGVPVQGVGRVWYKVWQGLVQGVTGFGTMYDRVWYKV